jgi:F-type H+-transporting ATPase subunit delta
MKGTKAASRYAKALLELAIETNKLDSVAADMNYLLETSKETTEFVTFLKSPVINSSKKISIFQEIFGQFEDLTMLFIKQVATNRREFLLPEIAFSFDAQLKEYKGIVPITIVSAAPLNNATRESILNKINASVKGELEVSEVIDADLIGGFMVRMGDMQIDASVASQLNNLKQRLTR